MGREEGKRKEILFSTGHENICSESTYLHCHYPLYCLILGTFNKEWRITIPSYTVNSHSYYGKDIEGEKVLMYIIIFIKQISPPFHKVTSVYSILLSVGC